MDYKKLGFGLGVFSIALGAAEVLAASRIARTLEQPKRKGLVRAFGARELLAGAGLLAAPASAAGVWGRVAGDMLDLAALSTAAARKPRNRSIRGALLFVAAATALDVYVARGLERTTGKFWPRRAAASG